MIEVWACNAILDNKISGDVSRISRKDFLWSHNGPQYRCVPFGHCGGENHAAITIVPPEAGYLESQTLSASVEKKDKRIWAFSDIVDLGSSRGTSADLLSELSSFSGWSYLSYASVAMI